MRRVGVYPGSFNPLTIAHLAIAERAVATYALERLDFVVSRVALGKEHLDDPEVDARMEVLERASASRPWMRTRLTDTQLVSDIAFGYDVVVMGADKWEQLHDLAFYDGSTEARNAALARLPTPAVVDRPPLKAPPQHRLDIPEELTHISATAVREGRREWLAPEALPE